MPKPTKITDEQLRNDLANGLSITQIAEKHDVNARTVSARKKKLAATGFDPENERFHKNPSEHAVQGYSTLVRFGEDDPLGRVLEWVKTSKSDLQQAEAIEAMRQGLIDEIPKEKKTKPPKQSLSSDIMNLYVISDYHLGMMSWGEETGGDWDLNIAEETIIKWFEHSIRLSPDSETAVFCNLADFLHWDGMEAVTPANKHVLDADSRFQKLVRVCIRIFRKVMSMLLKKHKQVKMIHAGGNHDPASTVWLREFFAAFYEEEPRIEVDVNPDLYCCHEFGLTSLFFHHGHKRRVGNIDTVFASKFRNVFGRTKNSYAHMGHLHSVDVKETNLMLIEQHRTLAAPDAYASSGGWMSGRDAKVITYHKSFGEVARNVISFDMIEALN